MNKYLLKIDVKCFNLKYTLDCGQCFRWQKLYENEDDKSNLIYEYIGVILDRVVKIRQEGNSIYINSDKEEGLKEAIYKYFDLYEDYEALENKISKIDDNVKQAVSNSTGIRILNQPIFETIISYIISSNNNIKRIVKSVNAISQKYGKKVLFENADYYLFPTEKELAMADEKCLKDLGTGFRCRYIKRSTEKINSEEKYLDNLLKLSTPDAKVKLTLLDGVGPKVSDCIMLFGMERKEVFPIDVWIKRIMEKIFMKKETSLNDIQKFALDNFGKDSGIVQQHLFYNAREGNV